MQTLHRPTNTNTPSRTQIAALGVTARTLWASEPRVSNRQRESLLVQLLAVEADVERLSLRNFSDAVGPEDGADLRNCSERLARLQRHWSGAAEADLLSKGELT